jgi:hypothetical protein
MSASRKGQIAGGVVGGILGLGLMAAIVAYLQKRQRKRKQKRKPAPTLEMPDMAEAAAASGLLHELQDASTQELGELVG